RACHRASFVLQRPRTPTSPLFPYTTLFRSYGLRSLADGYVPPILDVSKLDRKILVSNEDSVRGVRMLLEREGVFAGVSSGAVLQDRKSTRLNSSHQIISYAVCCLERKTQRS